MKKHSCSQRRPRCWSSDEIAAQNGGVSTNPGRIANTCMMALGRHHVRRTPALHTPALACGASVSLTGQHRAGARRQYVRERAVPGNVRLTFCGL